MINTKIQSWFSKGHFKEALLGEGNYKIPDVTYMEKHDRILIIGQLYIFVEQNLPQNIDNDLEYIIKNLLNTNFADAIDILFCYHIVKQNKNFSLFNTSNLKEDILKAIKNNAVEITTNEELRVKIVELNKYIPGIIK